MLCDGTLSPGKKPEEELSDPNLLQRLRLIARPVVFATHVSDAPFGILGTAFFIGYRGLLFIVTARHVIRDCSISNILIFPAPGARKAIGIAEYWHVEGKPSDDADTSDLLILRPTLKGVPRKISVSARVLAMDRPDLLDWFPARHSSTFYAFGYPRPLNSVDYERGAINMAQVLLAGNFIEHCRRSL